MTNLLERYLKWRRKVFPASKEDVAWRFEALVHKANEFQAVACELYQLQSQLADIRQMLIADRAPAHSIILKTDFPVAYESNDHIAPWGTKNDNTRSARFCRAVEQHFRRKLIALDLGCSGGGLVFDFLVRGHLAVGLEGSDFSLKTQRAEWRIIPDYLYTCDISKPFALLDKKSGDRQHFDVVTMWEVLEHIPEDDIVTLLATIKSHLAPDGLFVGSIALFDDIVDGVSYHPTVKPEPWWRDKFAACGLQFVDKTMFSFGDFCRGTGNGPMDCDFSKQPDRGFHFVAGHLS